MAGAETAVQLRLTDPAETAAARPVGAAGAAAQDVPLEPEEPEPDEPEPDEPEPDEPEPDDPEPDDPEPDEPEPDEPEPDEPEPDEPEPDEPDEPVEPEDPVEPVDPVDPDPDVEDVPDVPPEASELDPPHPANANPRPTARIAVARDTAMKLRMAAYPFLRIHVTFEHSSLTNSAGAATTIARSIRHERCRASHTSRVGDSPKIQ